MKPAARYLSAVFAATLALIAFTLTVPLSSDVSRAQRSEKKLAPEAGTISGRVFGDFNGDGVYDTSGGTTAAPLAIDAGVAGVAVTVYDSNGANQGSGTTNASGQYSIAATGTGPYRVEFTGLPAGYSLSARSTDSVSGGTATNAGSTEQFVPDGGTANVNLAINRPVDYCQNNPKICSQLYGLGAANQPESIFETDYAGGSTRTTGGNPVTDFQAPGNTSRATTDEVGTTFGLAYNRNANVVYAAAFLKKHAKFGPGGTGAIYQVNRNTGAVSEYVNLNTVFGANTAGANPHDVTNYDFDNGNTTWDAAGKIALGGMAISDDMANLFVINLADRKLYKIPTSGTLDSATITSSAFPATFTDCTTASNVRPFAVAFYEGQLYLGAVCSGQSGTATTNRLRMYVLQADPSTLVINAAPLINQRFNYTRAEIDPGASAAWNNWAATFTNLAAQGNFVYPQPMVTDLDFDRGNIIISVRDRMGDQSGYFNQSNPGNTADLRKGITGGDIIRGCGAVGSWTLESNGRCGGIGGAPQGSNEGLGGGEYYYQENYHPNGNPHDEVANGAATQIPGHNVMVASIMDPVYLPTDNIFDSGGFRWFDNSTGAQTKGYLAYQAGDFGKANGMGNVVALCDAAPIELGNRVWRDTNLNGVQDANEPGIAGITLHLYQASTLLATIVTDASGEYYFISGTAVDPNTADNIGIVNGKILRSTIYQIRMDNPANFATGGPAENLRLTTVDQTTQLGDDDSSDSDAVLVLNPGGSSAGTWPVISVTTGSGGSNTHALDLGLMFSPTAAGVTVAGRLTTSEGIGIRSVQVMMTTRFGELRRTMTGAFGFYAFEDVPAGENVLVTVSAKRFRFAQSSLVVFTGDSLANVDFVATP